MFEVKNVAPHLSPSHENQGESSMPELAKRILVFLKEFKQSKEISNENLQEFKYEIKKCIEIALKESDIKKVSDIASILAQVQDLPGNLLNYELSQLCNRIYWNSWGTRLEDNLPGYINDKKGFTTVRVNILFREIFKHYQLSPEQVFTAWRYAVFPIDSEDGRKGLDETEQQKLVLKNLGSLQDLERARPHSASRLAREFRLVNFGRYPLDMLINQYDHIDDLETPYGLIINARRDYNGALFSSDENKSFENLASQLKDDYRVRMAESGGKISFAGLLTRLNDKYGQKQKISFAVINSHGNWDVLSLGDWPQYENKNSISTLHVEDKFTVDTYKRIRSFFAEHATIVLTGCLAGKDSDTGIARKIFERLGIPVLASHKKVDHIDSINVKIENSRLNFKVKYKTANRFFPIRDARQFS